MDGIRTEEEKVPEELHFLSATEAIGLFRTGELSPVELMEAVIRRAEETEPFLNAFSDTFYEQALAQAREAERRYHRDPSSVRPLEGVPVALKEEHALEGYTYERGSLAYRGNIATETYPIAERVLDEGGIMHARTKTPEFSLAGYTQSRLWGITRNPWNLDYSPGGSSGGSAAALAAGSTLLATGSDIGGSIRAPASSCGITGYYPPYGRVPTLPPVSYDYYFQSGPLARTISDLALLQNVIAGPHPKDMASLRPKLEIPTDLAPIAGWTIGVSPDLGGYSVEQEVASNFAAALGAFEEAGATLRRVDLSVSPEEVRIAMMIHFGTLWSAGSRRDLEQHRSLLNPYSVDFIERGLAAGDDATPLDGLEIEAEIFRRVSAALGECDVLVCPTLGLPAFVAGEEYIVDPPTVAGRQLGYWWDAYLTCPFSITARCPVIAVPTGRASTGVPTGMQIVGQTFDDVRTFRAAATFERLRPWLTESSQRPQLPSGRTTSS